MGEKKIQKFVRRVAKYFDKYFTVYVYKDPDAVESMIIGPRHIIIITNRSLTETEIDNYINRFFESDPACIKCRRNYYGNYFRMGPNNNVICGDCDPTIKFAVAYFEAIDPLFRPTA